MATKKRIKSTPPEKLPTRAQKRMLSHDMDKPLTEMQQKFVFHYVDEQMNKSAAARLAGFKGNSTSAAQVLLDNPRVQKAVAEARAAFAKASGMTKQKVIDGFLEAIQMARITSDPIAMIGGFREIGKMCGFYEPTKTRIEVSMNGQILIDKLKELPDEELIKMLEEEDALPALEGDFHVVE